MKVLNNIYKFIDIPLEGFTSHASYLGLLSYDMCHLKMRLEQALAYVSTTVVQPLVQTLNYVCGMCYIANKCFHLSLLTFNVNNSSHGVNNNNSSSCEQLNNVRDFHEQ